jgi:hypothetical protein
MEDDLADLQPSGNYRKLSLAADVQHPRSEERKREKEKAELISRLREAPAWFSSKCGV